MMQRSSSLSVLGLLLLATPISAQIGLPSQEVLVHNVGQWETSATLVGFGPGYDVLIERGAIGLVLHGTDAEERPARALLRLEPESGSTAMPDGEDRLGPVFHFLGDAEGGHRRLGVDAFSFATLRNFWPGADLGVRLRRGSVELTVRSVDSAGGETVGLRIVGGAPTLIAARSAKVSTPFGALDVGFDGPPETPEARSDISVDGDIVRLISSPEGSTLTISLGIDWVASTGGSADDSATGRGVHPSGDVIISGFTSSPDFPTTPGVAFPTSTGSANSYVMRLDADTGNIVFATYFNGGNFTRAECGEVDPVTGDIVIGGSAGSGLPVTPDAFDPVANTVDTFLARLRDDGQALLYCTYFGDDSGNLQQISGVDVLADGSMAVVGDTFDGGIPTTPGAFQPTPSSDTDAFAARFDAAGGLAWSTYLRGTTGSEKLFDVVVHDSGEVTVVGYAGSAAVDYPTTPGAFQVSKHPGKRAGVVTRLSADGSRLVFSSFLGGPSGLEFTEVRRIAELPGGELVLAGLTESLDFPVTPGAYDIQLNNSSFITAADAFIARMSSDGAALPYATFIGGGGVESLPVDLAVDASGMITLVGWTTSATFPVTPGAATGLYSGNDDIFVARLHPSGGSLLYSTYLGGSGFDHSPVVAALADGSVVVACDTRSANFGGPPDPILANLPDSDLGIARLSMLPIGVERFGTSSPVCGGTVATAAGRHPAVGDHGFSLASSGAAPGTVGLLVLGTGALPTSLPLLGARLWVDPATVLRLFPVFADAHGFAETDLPIPGNPALVGAVFHAQTLWPDPCRPGQYGATSGLTLTIQQP